MTNKEAFKQMCVGVIVWLDAYCPEVFDENSNPCDRLKETLNDEISAYYKRVSNGNIYFCNRRNKIYALDCVCKTNKDE